MLKTVSATSSGSELADASILGQFRRGKTEKTGPEETEKKQGHPEKRKNGDIHAK